MTNFNKSLYKKSRLQKPGILGDAMLSVGGFFILLYCSTALEGEQLTYVQPLVSTQRYHLE